MEEKTVKLERKKGTLGFSIKGGCEHGIPIVVSFVEKKSFAASKLTLGDELVSVNGLGMQGISHKEAVHIIKTAGQSVIIRIRTNPVLQSTFFAADETTKHEDAGYVKLGLNNVLIHVDDAQLPPGWNMKKDSKTDQPYFENHYTKVSTWTDPRCLPSIPLDSFNFKALPPSWERLIDQYGDIYYVNHDSHTTHWDSPRGMREQEQLKQLHKFITDQRQTLTVEEKQLNDKRAMLLLKTKELENRKNQEDDASAMEDIITLNEETEELQNMIHIKNQKLQQLNTILHNANQEDIDKIDENITATDIAYELQKLYKKYKELDQAVSNVIYLLEDLRTSEGKNSGALQYMLQLKPYDTSKDVIEEAKWIHLLPDKLTAKTNIEMRLSNCTLSALLPQMDQLFQRVNGLYTSIMENRFVDWDHVIGQLVNMDFSIIKDEHIGIDCFREKLSKYMEMN